ncbi:MAG: hypothetical protein ABH830_00595 [Patescibacteria group bacterium]
MVKKYIIDNQKVVDFFEARLYIEVESNIPVYNIMRLIFPARRMHKCPRCKELLIIEKVDAKINDTTKSINISVCKRCNSEQLISIKIQVYKLVPFDIFSAFEKERQRGKFLF